MDKNFWELTPAEAVAKLTALGNATREMESRPVRWGLVPQVRMSPNQIYAVASKYVEGTDPIIDKVIEFADRGRKNGRPHFLVPAKAALHFFNAFAPSKGTKVAKEG